MNEQDKQVLLSLLTEQRVGTLAVLAGEHPYASLVPFALNDNRDAALIHASKLAKHSEGLTREAPYSLLVHQPDLQMATNPAQLARATLLGSVEPMERNGDGYAEARVLYLDKFPKSEITFQLGDFTLFALQIESCRFVAGFAKTFDLTPADLRDLS